MKRFLAAALLACAWLPACAVAAALPGVDCFSPGLERAREAVARGEALSAGASFSVENAFYARDLAVLSDMLSDVRVLYDGAGDYDGLRIVKGEETLLDAARFGGEGGPLLAVDGELYALSGEPAALPEALEAVAQAGVAGDARLREIAKGGLGLLLADAPLEQIASALEALDANEALPGGMALARPFTLTRTMSEDGGTLSRLDVSGAGGPAGEAPYEIAGFVRHVGGKKPTDSFEITLTRDEDNHFTLTGKSVRAASVTSKDRAGTVTIETTASSQGELAGNRIDSRLTIRLTNQWTADEQGALNEKITVSVHVGHTDRTPGRRMLRLNDLSLDVKGTLTLATQEEGDSPVAIGDKVSIDLVMDGNTFLKGGMDAQITLGGAAAAPKRPDGAQTEAISTPEEGEALLQKTVLTLAERLYARLGKDSINRVKKGLE